MNGGESTGGPRRNAVCVIMPGYMFSLRLGGEGLKDGDAQGENGTEFGET